jgi:hypothetical protein
VVAALAADGERHTYDGQVLSVEILAKHYGVLTE